MKTNVVIVVIIAILLTSCTPTMPTQEIEVTNHVPTKVSFTEVAMTQELVVTEELIATEAPTKAPSKTPLSCVTLLTPPNGAEIPAIGKVTFSWNPMNEATFYVLNIMLPSGETVSFDTKQTFRGQYMEAFSAGGQYQWRVIVQDRKRNEICSSELATFRKPTYNQPQQPRNDDSKRK
jgi:hypothetical protein